MASDDDASELWLDEDFVLPGMGSEAASIHLPTVALGPRRKPPRRKDDDVDNNELTILRVPGEDLNKERKALDDTTISLQSPDIDSVRSRVLPAHIHTLAGGPGRVVTLSPPSKGVSRGTKTFVVAKDFLGFGTMRAPLHLEGSLCTCLRHHDSNIKIGACAKDALVYAIEEFRFIVESPSIYGLVRLAPLPRPSHS